MSSETEKIAKRYEKRSSVSDNSEFIRNAVAEREKIYSQIIFKEFSAPEKINLMEVGAGGGGNISFFLQCGIKQENIFASELLPQRVQILRKNFPGITITEGDARNLPYQNKFDIVFQSLVFTSILDKKFKKELAVKMWDMLKPGGIILWYDFKYNNPANPDVKGIGRNEIRELFPLADSMDFYNVTLAPPLARRTRSLYSLINLLFPLLRTHIIAVMRKNNQFRFT